jgi:hypothetical protein
MSKFSTKYFLAIALSTILWLSVVRSSFANVSAPIINFGSGRTLTSLDSKNTNAVAKIQMQSEVVRISLYPGFSVVKGEYHMVNTSKEAVKIQVGYPSYDSIGQTRSTQEKRFQVQPPGDLSNLRALVNGREVSTTKVDNQGQWYVWPMEFLPQQATDITVYYMTDTWRSIKVPSYSIISADKQLNLFEYILESGAVWGKRIEKGTIFIKLNSKMSDQNILGILPKGILKYNSQEHYLIYRFENLKPTPANNIRINYGDTPPSKDFQAESKQFQQYYQDIDRLVVPATDPPNLVVLTQTEFSNITNSIDRLKESSSVPVTIIFLLLILVVIPCLVIVGIGWLLRYFYRRLKAKR